MTDARRHLSPWARPAPDPRISTGGFDPALSCGHGAEIARLRKIEEAARALVTNNEVWLAKHAECMPNDCRVATLRAALAQPEDDHE